jgi:hypothetical protein
MALGVTINTARNERATVTRVRWAGMDEAAIERIVFEAVRRVVDDIGYWMSGCDEETYDDWLRNKGRFLAPWEPRSQR